MNASAALPAPNPLDAFKNVVRGMRRNTLIAASVVVFHVFALWAFQSGLLRRAVEIIVPVEMLSEFIEPPAPKVVPLLPAPPVPVMPRTGALLASAFLWISSAMEIGRAHV